ncbi:MAG: hypothetical protein ABR537_05920 [Gemmatimonadales bacterium]
MKTVALLLALASPLAAQEVFTHELVTMTLPAGWVVQPKPDNAEAEYVAALQGANKAGNAVITAANYGDIKETMARGTAMVQAALPGAIAEGDVKELKADNGDRILLQGFTATMQYGGKDVPLGAVLAVTVNGKRGVIAQVYFAPQFANRVGKEFGQLVRSFK